MSSYPKARKPDSVRDALRKALDFGAFYPVGELERAKLQADHVKALEVLRKDTQR